MAILTSRRALIALTFLVTSAMASCDFRCSEDDQVWQFNFAPEVAPDFLEFDKVSASTHYDRDRGYGWLDSSSAIEIGTYQQETPGWEATENLNLIMRAGPDDLARSFASGSASFALDLEDGIYDVWVLTGDWGYLEYFPYQPYRIEIEDAVIEIPGLSEREFFRHLETPGRDDSTLGNAVYRRYVEPRFQWKKETVRIADGQLSIRVVGPRRDSDLVSITGYYPWTDARLGPTPFRFGALNGLVVTSADGDGAARIAKIDERRRAQFHAAHPWAPVSSIRRQGDESDRARGYKLFVPENPHAVFPETTESHDLGPIELRATAGESVPFNIAIDPHRELGTVQVQVEGLPFPVDAGVVRYELAPVERGELTLWERALRKYFGQQPGPLRWRIQPGPIVPSSHWEMNAETTKQFWLTLELPTDAVPGTYTGQVDVRPDFGEPSRIQIELEVLPFVLRRPTHLAVGATYFVPVAYAFYGKERFWRRVRTEFEDMRRHGMTTVQLTGMGIENYDGLDRLFAEYRRAGFEQPVYLLEAYAAIEWIVDRYGYSRGSDAFYSKYVDLFEAFVAESERRDWPPITINFGDEFTNTATEDFGAELARRLKRIPGIVTAADANGHREVMQMAAHASIVAFNQGWEGPGGVNRGRSLLNAETVAEVQAAGAEPWLVNIDMSRFSNGLYLWKMSRLGIGGKIEWIYNDYSANPHNPFDGRGPRPRPMIYPGRGSSLSTIAFERMRQGLDDLAYLHTLESIAGEAPEGPQRDAALALIERIDAMIDDDYSRIHGPGADRWTEQRYRELRDQVIEQILALMGG